MATTDAEGQKECPACAERITAGAALHECMICRSLFCQRCAVTGYGRLFCSERCRGYFFYGDDDAYRDEKEE